MGSGENLSRKLVGFLACKSKVTTADFMVDEVIDFRPEAQGPFYLYRLKKEGWNTVDALIRIAKENRLSLRDVQYGGKKDRHGITEQCITSRKPLRLPESFGSAVHLSLLGRCNAPMGPGHIVGNRFTLTLRSLHSIELSHLHRNYEVIKSEGYINYFDSQRFSTYDREDGLPAFSLFAGDYEACLKMLLLGTFRREKSHAKDRKADLLRLWGNWKLCLEKADTAVERRVFSFLNQGHGADFRDALELLPFEEVLMMLSAFQAFLWNHIVSAQIENHSSGKAALFKTRTGILAFPVPEDRSVTPDDELSLPGRDEVFSPEYQRLLDHLLRDLNLPIGCTVTAPLSSASMNAYMRKIRIVPEGFQISDAEDDELDPGRKKITLRFTLPAGAYGTMLVKRLTLRARF